MRKKGVREDSSAQRMNKRLLRTYLCGVCVCVCMCVCVRVRVFVAERGDGGE